MKAKVTYSPFSLMYVVFVGVATLGRFTTKSDALECARMYNEQFA